MISAIVSDLDDTLLRSDNTISDYSVSVFRKASDAGCKIILASGRAYQSMKPYIEQLGNVDIAISSNGAEIWDKSGRLLNLEVFSCEEAISIADYGEQRNFYMQTYEGGKFFYSRREKCKYAELYARMTKLEGVYVGDLRKFFTKPTSKILMIDEIDTMARELPIARKLFADVASVTCSKPYFLEFNPKNATKGKAVNFAANALEISISEMMAFGDSINDLSMLEAVGHGVCVENAREDVKAAIENHCLSHDEDGVARYIAEHVL